ncbi:MAG: CARDB domain-containing protein, partial [Eubacteriales bacterium]|nr:CARDB domain-containing protein [Eubacteriales bacterium]
RISGLNTSNSEVSLEETVYVPVAGVGGSGNLDLEISDVQAPESVSAGSDFSVSFTVHNQSAYDAVNVKAELKVPEGVINKTKNVFLIDRIAPGASQGCTVTLNARQGGEYQLFEISAGSADGTQTVSQYGGTMILGGGGGTNPQLMVSAYSYGGQPVRAGNAFTLSLTLNNTSSGTALQNIKVTVTSDDSAFLPVGTSNAFYVPSIAANSAVTHQMSLAAKKDAEQRTSTITVAMSYEDTAGSTYSASDIISIPVIQETRLVIDDILDPGYLTADQMGYLNVNYYNMGKTQLSNLRVTAEGDFTVEGSATMYVGNMASGKSDYYSINFFPNGPGPLNGKVTFTFEDAAGDEQMIEKLFTFQVGEAMVWEEDPNMPLPEDMPSGGMSAWKAAAILLAASAAVLGAVKYRKRRKLIRDEEFDLNE